ncbi:MAG: PIN domain-containing protein [Acidimicrobiia bacterium]
MYIDTSELYPFTIMDVLLTMSEELLFTWVWTDELLDEWERVIVEGGVRTRHSARSVTDAARAGFASSRIDPALYREKITEDLSPDPDDRVHVAACIEGGATVLLTRNTKDFPEDSLARAGVRVLTADAYLVELLRRRPRACHDAFVATAAARGRPPVTPCELADRIDRAGAPKFAARMHRRLICP